MPVIYFEGVVFKSDIFFTKVLSPDPQILAFWTKKYKLSNINLACTLFRKCWFQIWHLFSKVLSPNLKIWAIWVKKNQFSNLNKILPVSYFEGANSKSDIHFEKFWAQITKIGNFGQKKYQLSNLNKMILHVP